MKTLTKPLPETRVNSRENVVPKAILTTPVEVITAMGGNAATAAALGCTDAAVGNWRRFGIPAKWAEKIRSALPGRVIDLGCFKYVGVQQGTLLMLPLHVDVLIIEMVAKGATAAGIRDALRHNGHAFTVEVVDSRIRYLATTETMMRAALSLAKMGEG